MDSLLGSQPVKRLLAVFFLLLPDSTLRTVMQRRQMTFVKKLHLIGAASASRLDFGHRWIMTAFFPEEVPRRSISIRVGKMFPPGKSNASSTPCNAALQHKSVPHGGMNNAIWPVFAPVLKLHALSTPPHGAGSGPSLGRRSGQTSHGGEYRTSVNCFMNFQPYHLGGGEYMALPQASWNEAWRPAVRQLALHHDNGSP